VYSQVAIQVQEAFAQSRKLRIDYYTASEDRVSTRVVTPLEILHKEGDDFLIAFCEVSQSQRTFRIDRIREIELLQEKSEKIAPIILPTATINTKISISRDFRKCYESLGVDAPISDSQVSLATFSPQWILRTVISAGGAMTIAEPVEVRSEVASRAKTALELYG
jgi:proteasome accessory factor C